MASPAPSPPTASGLEDAMARLSVDAPASLLDLPAPWLRQLIQQELEPKQLLATSHTCQILQHEVLTGRHVTLTAPMHEPGAEHRHISLQRTCQFAASVHLKLAGTAPVDPQQQAGEEDEEGDQAQPSATPALAQQHNPVQTAQAYLANAVTALGPALMDTVTQVTLQGMSLDALVPSWLTDACPQLTSLCLEDVTLTLPDQPTHRVPNTNVKHLTLPAPAGSGSSQEDDAMAWAYKAHLQSLTALQELTLSTPLNFLIIFALAAPPTPITLTRLSALHLPAQPNRADRHHLMIVLCQYLPALTQLSIPQLVVADDVMALLLQNLPALHTLRCDAFSLQQDYSQCPCSWRHLHVSFFDLDDVAALPLHCLNTITIHTRPHAATGGPVCRVTPSSDPEVAGRVIQEVQRMGGLRWAVQQTFDHRQPLSIIGIGRTAQGVPTEQHMQVVATLLSTYTPRGRGTVLGFDLHLTPTTLQVCTQLPQLLHTPGHDWVPLLEPDSVDPEVWPQLLPATRKAPQMLILARSLVLTEAALTAILSAVPRPRVVTVHTAGVRATEGWLQRLQAAAAASAESAMAAGGVSAVLQNGGAQKSKSLRVNVVQPDPANSPGAVRMVCTLE